VLAQLKVQDSVVLAQLKVQDSVVLAQPLFVQNK
jgi:hypothetical protein